MVSKRIVRDTFLRHFGLEASSRPPALLRHPDWTFEGYLDLVVAYHLRHHPDLMFVQVGAFDGLGVDPIRPLVRRYGLRGIVVEPEARAFDALKATYADSPQVIPVNVAVAETAGIRDLFSRAGRPMPQASLSRAHLVKHGVPPDQITSQRVRCLTLVTLMKEHGLSRCDLLQIDAEGHDYDIVRTIDFDVVAPFVIRFEHMHMTNRQRDVCVRLLAERGYRFIVERCDITALRLTPPADGASRSQPRAGPPSGR